jgi:hypothetical protein
MLLFNKLLYLKEINMQKTVICYDNFIGNAEGWVIEGKKMIAWRISDKLNLTIKEKEVEYVFKSVISKYKEKNIYLILVNNHQIFSINVIKFLLIKEIIKIENCSKIILKEDFWTRSWWRGEDFYIDFLIKWTNKKSLKLVIDKKRYFLKPLRNIVIFLWYFKGFLKQICKLKIHQSFWESQNIFHHKIKNNYKEALWIIPGVAAFKYFEGFIKSNLIEKLNISKITVMEYKNRDMEYYKKLNLSKKEYSFSFIKIIFHIIRSVGRDFFLLRKEKGDNSNDNLKDIIYFMYPAWYAKIFEKTEQYRFYFIINKIFANNNSDNFILFSTHNEGPEVSALYQVNKNIDRKTTFIYIEHGINYRFYFPLDFNKYYVLTKNDSDYLKRIGISQSKINIMGLLNVLDQRKPNTAHSNNIKLKKLKKRIVLVSQYSEREIFSLSYIFTYIKLLENISRKYGWELLIRPHPQRETEWIRNNFSNCSNIKILDLKVSLVDTLLEVSPLIAVTFFSTSILEISSAGILPVSIQVDLEEIVSWLRFPYEKLSVVIKKREDVEPFLVRLMNDDSFRENKFKKIKIELKKILVDNLE